MDFLALFMLIAVASVHGFNRTRLEQPPRAKPFFDENKYAGLWYVQAILSPHTLNIPSATDFTSYYKLQPDGKLLAIESWRVTHCNYVTFSFTPSLEPGIYAMKDSIGDLVSGQSIVVETDYVTYAVKWGCAARSPNGTCTAPYVLIQTRSMKPSAFTMLTAETVLNLIWKLPLSKMTTMPHKQPCDDKLVRGQVGGGQCGPSKSHTAGTSGQGGMFTNSQRFGHMNPFQQMSMFGLLDGMA